MTPTVLGKIPLPPDDVLQPPGHQLHQVSQVQCICICVSSTTVASVFFFFTRNLTEQIFAIIGWVKICEHQHNGSPHTQATASSREDAVIVLDLVSQVRDVVLMNVYLDLENPGGVGILE